MKNISRIMICFGLAAASSFAQAGTVPSQSAGGLYLHGYAGAGYYDYQGSGSGSFYRMDIDTGLRPASGLGFGFNLGIEAFGTESRHDSALYPTVSYGTGIGTFSVGVPRFLMDGDYLPEYHFANTSFIEGSPDFFRILWGSASGARYLSATDDTPYGLRYDGVFGQTKVGLAYNRFDTVSTDVYSAAFRHEMGGFGRFSKLAVFGGVENIHSSGSATVYRVGAEADSDRMSAGILYTFADASGSNLSGGTVYTNYKIGKNLMLNGALAHVELFGSVITMAGVGAEYRFLHDRAYAKASVLRADQSGAKTVLEASVGVQF